MTECYTYRDVDVECCISDDGKLSMNIMGKQSTVLLSVGIHKIYRGEIPWRSLMKQ